MYLRTGFFALLFIITIKADDNYSTYIGSFDYNFSIGINTLSGTIVNEENRIKNHYHITLIRSDSTGIDTVPLRYAYNGITGEMYINKFFTEKFCLGLRASYGYVNQECNNDAKLREQILGQAKFGISAGYWFLQLTKLAVSSTTSLNYCIGDLYRVPVVNALSKNKELSSVVEPFSKKIVLQGFSPSLQTRLHYFPFSGRLYIFISGTAEYDLLFTHNDTIGNYPKSISAFQWILRIGAGYLTM